MPGEAREEGQASVECATAQMDGQYEGGNNRSWHQKGSGGLVLATVSQHSW